MCIRDRYKKLHLFNENVTFRVFVHGSTRLLSLILFNFQERTLKLALNKRIIRPVSDLQFISSPKISFLFRLKCQKLFLKMFKITLFVQINFDLPSEIYPNLLESEN